MSKKSKITWSVIVIVIIIAGAFMLFGISSTTNVPAKVGTTTNEVLSQQNQFPSTGGIAMDTSNASLSSDLGQIDAQMSGLNSDVNKTAPASDSQ